LIRVEERRGEKRKVNLCKEKEKKAQKKKKKWGYLDSIHGSKKKRGVDGQARTETLSTVF